MFFTIFLFFAGWSFWTLGESKLASLFSDSGKDIFQYPADIFHQKFQLFLTYILPFAFFNYYPMQYLFEKENSIFYALSPLLIMLWTVVSYMLWVKGLKQYNSTGS
ncbi:ABC-2 family transporter protein [Clostridium sp. D2Q-14]|nr:ABC-2 family transporter protein [Anaeromonas gelatinilytica]